MTLLLLLSACKGRIFTPGSGGDEDGDGYEKSVDCDDEDASVYPDAEELCDGVDQDCDDLIDEGVGVAAFTDADGDGFGDPATEQIACDGTDGLVTKGRDCDDSRAEVHPEGREVCNGWDDDCDGQIDDADDDVDPTSATTWTVDGDGDGWGAENGATKVQCAQPQGYADNADDCDDSSAAVQPTEYWKDGDGDTYGNPDEQFNTCGQAPNGFVDRPGDCDDLNRFAYPGAPELCDDEDNDCDGSADDAGLVSFYDLSTWRDVSAELTGTADTPAEWISDKKGVLHVCEGTWFATLEFQHSVDVVGHGAAVLDAGLVRSVLYMEGGGMTVAISDIEVTGGEADGAALGNSSYPAGGGLYCRGANTVTLDGVKLRGNQGYMGAGLYSEECDITVTDSSIVLNSAIWTGGGVAVTGGTVELINSEVFKNDAGNNGGGFYIGGNSSSPLVVVEDSVVNANTAGTLGGGASIYDGTLRCTAGSGDYGFWGNSTDESGGAVFFYEDANLSSSDCDWGEGQNDNAPDDFSNGASYGVDATFSCTTDACQ
jgi:hypothetical protein